MCRERWSRVVKPACRWMILSLNQPIEWTFDQSLSVIANLTQDEIQMQDCHFRIEAFSLDSLAPHRAINHGMRLSDHVILIPHILQCVLDALIGMSITWS